MARGTIVTRKDGMDMGQVLAVVGNRVWVRWLDMYEGMITKETMGSLVVIR